MDYTLSELTEKRLHQHIARLQGIVKGYEQNPNPGLSYGENQRNKMEFVNDLEASQAELAKRGING